MFYCCFIFFTLNACSTLDEKDSANKQEKQNEIEKIKEANSFLKDVATGVYQEVELSRLAMEKASLTKVKEFAKNVVSDYDNNLSGLRELAARKKITIRLTGSDELQSRVKNLSALQGVAFDKEYIKMMVTDHEQDVQKFRDEAERGKDIETKAFAAGKLSILIHHLDMAKTLHDSMIGT